MQFELVAGWSEDADVIVGWACVGRWPVGPAVGPSFTPTGFSIPLRNSTCAPSIALPARARVATTAFPAGMPAATSVAQGQLETSNNGPTESAVRLVSVMRQFEMLQKAVTLGAEMNRKAIEEVAKV
jgi:hypothetical protein